VPFTCENCGGRSDLIPAVGGVLRCPRCNNERPFFKPPLLVITGAAGVGKSTLCARLAGTIPNAVLLDADVHAEDLISVIPPNQDYVAFWRSMMRLAHELAQNGVAVVYFSAMLPEQLLGNTDVLGYFESVQFLCLDCPSDVLRGRLERRLVRDGLHGDVSERIRWWADFNTDLVTAANELPQATVIDASRTTDLVEQDVRDWITGRWANAE
jgi:predicted ABC-type ATPase